MNQTAGVRHEGLIIRDAVLDDAAGIARVRVAAQRMAYRSFVPVTYLDWPGLELQETRQLSSALEAITQGTHVSVAVEAEQIVGYCAYGVCGHAPGLLPHGGIYDLFVHPPVWRRGLGTALLIAARKQFQLDGFPQACLFVYEANTQARSFYERLGWTPDGHREFVEHAECLLAVLRYQILIV